MKDSSSRIEAGTRVEIDRSIRRLYFHTGDQKVNTYQVAMGKSATPTPLGAYRVVNKVVNPGGVLGTRWMGLDIPNGPYGIHGTNNPSSIGKYISNGCIRMHNPDVEVLFPMVSIGTPVIITDSQGQYPPPPLQEGAGRRHMVKPGDTLWNISRMYGVTMEDIIRANGIKNPDALAPGQVLVIP